MSRRDRSRRFGGGAPFLPPQLPGLQLWLRADLGITIGTGVSAWADQSGNGHNVTQGTGSAQPTLNASDAAYNHQPTLSFASASSQVLLSASWSLPQPFTYILVGNMSGAAVTQAFCDFATQEAAMYNGGAGNRMDLFLSATVTGVVTNNITPSVYGGIFNHAGGATASAIFQNNSQTALQTGDVGAGTANGAQSIGALSGPSGFLNGKLAEVIFYNFALSPSQLQQVFTYLGSRYAMGTS